MRKRLIFFLIFITILIFGIGTYYWVRTNNSPGYMEQIWRYNMEDGRDASTTLLDCALLVKMTDPMKFLMLGHISETTIWNLEELAELYAESGNKQRSKWLHSLVKKFEMESIGESYEPYYAAKSEHEKAWEDVEKLISDGNMNGAFEKSKNDPFLSAKLGEFYAKQGTKEDSLQSLQTAVNHLHSDTPKGIRYDTLKTAIFGYIKLNENQIAINLYRENKEDLMNLPILMITAFIEKQNYNSAFSMLQDDSWSLYEALVAIAKGHIGQNRQSLKNEHKEIIKTIVMRRKGTIKKLSTLSHTKPGSNAYRDVQKKLIDAINKADRKNDN